jgi:hypothetical protein
VTPTGGRPLARFSVLDLTTVRSTSTKILGDFWADDAATVDALVAEGVIEQRKGETK